MTTNIKLDAKTTAPVLFSVPEEETECVSDLSASYEKSTIESCADAPSTSWCECLSAPFVCIWNSIASCVSAIFNALFCCCPKDEVNLKEVWKETELHVQKRYIDAVNATAKKTIKYEAPAGNSFVGTHETIIEVVKEHSLDRALALHRKGHQVLVLNIAHPTKVGGGFQEGVISQEAEIMRRSALSFTNFFPVPIKGGIYVPNVPVFRHGPSENYAFMHTPVNLDFVSVAALSDFRLQPNTENEKMRFFPKDAALIRDKIRIQLEIGYRSGNKTLVLGAFGCAIFNNPAPEIARIYKEVIEKEFSGCFRLISFCIPEGEKVSKIYNPNGIFEPFQEVFKEANL